MGIGMGGSSANPFGTPGLRFVENIFTTHMPLFLEKAAYRSTIYKNQFPTGSWLGVKELVIPEFMIEIELEVHISE